MTKLRVGMIGGGENAFIGEIHRYAMALSLKFDLVCGAFSRSHNNSLNMGKKIGIPPSRCYPDIHSMLSSEQQLPLNERMQLVVIVTPNKTHFFAAKLALEYGFNVFCEKPATMRLSEAIELEDILKSSIAQFTLAHTYHGYPMVLEARSRVHSGEIGQVQKVIIDYSQGWLADINKINNKQSIWRLSRDESGISCCMGDIGVHAAQLSEFITGLFITDVLADLSSVGKNRELDDDGSVLLKFNSGARGILNASQVCVGEENNLSIRIYGSKGHIKWQQMEPNSLILSIEDKPVQILRSAHSYNQSVNMAYHLTPAGHPEGYIEAFSTLYAQIYQQITSGTVIETLPNINAGIKGMAFIEGVVLSNKNDNTWINIDSLIQQERNS